MKIINQKEIEEAASSYIEGMQTIYSEYAITDFKAGALWAESKFEKIAIEFITWLTFEPQVTDYDRNKVKYEKLFKRFIKRRNEKHDN